MYSPLVKAFNYALDKLAKFEGPGLPEFQEKRQIVFASSASKYVESESYLQGRFKPDIILVKWDTFGRVHQCTGVCYSRSYESDICCNSGYDCPRLSWRNLLSTLEVKRGHSGKCNAKGNVSKSTYDRGFRELGGDHEAASPPQPQQSVPPKAVRETIPTRRCMSITFFVFLHILIDLSSVARKPEKLATLTLTLDFRSATLRIAQEGPRCVRVQWKSPEEAPNRQQRTT